VCLRPEKLFFADGRDGALALEAVKRGIERAGVHLERVARSGPDHLRDPVAVTLASMRIVPGRIEIGGE